MVRVRHEARRAAREAALRAFDDELRAAEGITRLAGVDEVGRGPLAGPVVAAAVLLPPGVSVPGADDSKSLTPDERERVAEDIRRVALSIGFGLVRPALIDRMNILEASRLAMRRAVLALDPAPELVVVDGWEVPRFPAPQHARPKADATSLSVACASIVAKVRRDRIMARWHRVFPRYDFAGNKGYPTPAHRAALVEFGPCPIHRRSFQPVAQTALAFD
jgi:ribonuclease HII